MSDVVIRAEGLSKRYLIGGPQARYRTLRDSIAEVVRAPFRRLRAALRGVQTDADEEIWALRDVSFEVRQAEIVGVIGSNGAGKSTLLKVLSRITEPTAGRALTRGRIGSLLEVGTGFHNELTGRENIYLNGAILGMKKSEIDRKFDEIAAFAETERFLDTAVKHYSSGMYMRLAFAVAAHLDPEILVVDEVLAVGDAAFQRKCLGKMGDVARQGRTVLLVSHNMAAIGSLCGTGLWLDHGRCRAFGPVDSVVDAYLSSVSVQTRWALESRVDRKGDGAVRFASVDFFRRSGDATVVCGGEVNIAVGFTVPAGTSARNVSVSLGLNGLMGDSVLVLGTDLVGFEIEALSGHGRLVCTIDRLPVVAGEYSVNLFCTVSGGLADWVVDAARLVVEQGDFFGSGRMVPSSHAKVLAMHAWRVES
jgi:lipopolysaccharide transport system ATP-binding protein